MVELCIYTRNMRLFYEVTKKFRKENIPFTALDSFRDTHKNARLLLTTVDDIESDNQNLPVHISILAIEPHQSVEEILILTKQHLAGIKIFKKIIIAIDPGTEKTGMAIFLDDRLIYSREMYDLYQLIKFIEKCFLVYPNHAKLIKLGDGYRPLTKKFLNRLLCNQISKQNVQYMIVKEYNTSRLISKNACKDITIHERAAIKIGLRPGEVVSANNID